MKVLICLISQDRAIKDFFGSKKDQIIPEDSLDRGVRKNIDSVATVVYVADKDAQNDLGNFLLRKTKDADACLLLVDNESARSLVGYLNAAFVCLFDSGGFGKNKLNFFRQLTSRALKAFSQLLHRKDQSPLWILPLRNFEHQNLLELVHICSTALNENDFGGRLDSAFFKLRSLVRPRRGSSYKTRYVVDERGRFFSYGLERHAQFETGAPHASTCSFAGTFRFGMKVDSRRHFNVSEGEGDKTSITGVFFNCHDERVDASSGKNSTTHLNMFCNDFF